MINNRQAGRRRGRGGNGQGQGGQGGGNGPRQNGGQRDNGNRIDSRARGNASQLYEKYKNLASDAQRQGDRVNTEYYLQFADHYFRVLSETRNRFEEQNQQRRQQNDGYEAQAFVGSFDTGFDNQDDEFGDEGEPIRPNEQRLGEQAPGEDSAGDSAGDSSDREAPRDGNRQNGAANGQGGQNGQRDHNQRDGTPREAGDRPRRDGRQQRDGNRQDDGGDRGAREQGGQRDVAHPRYEGARTDAPRDDQPRSDRPRDDEPRRASRVARRDDVAPEAVPVNAEDAPAAAPVEAEAPRRRGRPPRIRPAEDDAPAAFDAALLPPSLGIAPASTAMEAAPDSEEKPRRRRVRATEAPPIAG